MPSTSVFIVRGLESNIRASVINGVDRILVELVLGIRVPDEAVDLAGRVHLWGIPLGGSEKYWEIIKNGDVLIILPMGGKKRAGERPCYITVAVGKYPITKPQTEIEQAASLSKQIWKAYKGKKGNIDVYPYLVFINSKLRIEELDEIVSALGLSEKELSEYRGSITRISPKKLSAEATQKLISRTLITPDPSTLFKLIEEVYLILSAKYGWNPVNCYHYSTKYNVCYGAPIPVGNKSIWGSEGLFEGLNIVLREKGYAELAWEYFKEILKVIEKPGIIQVTQIIAPNGNVEPRSITFTKPVYLLEM